MNTIGIDFGTSFCTASWINPRTSKPEAITFFGNGKQKMPSVVYFSPAGKVVGQAAYDQLENSIHMNENDRNQIITSIVQSIKRKMQQDQKIYLSDGSSITHEGIIAEILLAIKKDVELGCFDNQEVQKVIITHPVSFPEWKKEMLKKAAGIAGFKSVNLLEEPVAAAMGYAASAMGVGKNILVYDFGGGTFDVAFVVCDEDGFYRVPVEPEGDPYCGGDDIDMVIYNLWESEAKKNYDRSISSCANRVDLGFYTRCRRQKENLSMMELGNFSEVLPPPGFHRLEMKITRTDFSKIIEPIIDKTISKTEQLINKLNDKGYKIDTAVLIGGSSHIPIVYERLRKILPVEPRRPMQVDVAVALGAIMYDRLKENGKIIPEKMFCVHCGKGILNAYKYCIYCGRPNSNYSKS